MKSKKNLFLFSCIVFVLRTSCANPVESFDPNSYECYEEYTCNGCGIIQVTVNGKTCQVCTCGEQFQKIKNEIFPFTSSSTKLRTRPSRTPATTKTTTLATKKTDPAEFICTEEYDCNCGVVQISANGKTCQVCSCGEQFSYFTQNVKPFLKPSIARITRTTKPNPRSYVCYDEPDCSCGTFRAYINRKICTICLCGPQIEFLAREVIPNLVVTRNRIVSSSTSSNAQSAASFTCTEEYACENNCGIVQITTLKNTCQVCGCGNQYKYFMNEVYLYLKSSTKSITRPSRVSRPTNQEFIDSQLTCYDETECSCKMLTTTLNGKTCRICKCGNQIEDIIEKILPKLRP